MRRLFPYLLVALLGAAAAQADQKISGMPAATLPLAGTELVPIVQSGGNFAAPASAFGGNATLISSGTLPCARLPNLTGAITSSGCATTFSGVVPLANGGTGTATPSLIAGTNITITGSWPNQTVNSSGGGGGGGALTCNPGTLVGNNTLVVGLVTCITSFNISGITTGAPGNLNINAGGSIEPTSLQFPATAYGTTGPLGAGVTPCTWTSAGDVGPCINQAIAAAIAAGGGSVIVPASTNVSGACYGVATQIGPASSGVNLIGGGVGQDPVAAPTLLCWNGGVTSNPIVMWAPTGNTTASASSLFGFDVGCNSTANIGIEIAHVNNGNYAVGATDCRQINTWITTLNQSTGPGTQNNNFYLWSHSSSATYAPTGVLIDGYNGTTFNVSDNTFWLIHCATFRLGDCLVLGAEDNNTIDSIRAFPTSQTNATGNYAVFANSTYLPPSGLAMSGNRQNTTMTRVLHSHTPVSIQGLGDFVTPTVTTTSTLAYAPTSMTTNASFTSGATVLTFGSLGGTVVANELLLCTFTGSAAPGINSGVYPYDPIVSVTGGGTSVTVLNPTKAVASSTVCTARMGINATSAATSKSAGVMNVVTYTAEYFTGTGQTLNTYTCTAAGWCIVPSSYPAAGGTPQNGIAHACPLVFTDAVIPCTGTPNNLDTITWTVPLPTGGVTDNGVDRGNSIPLGAFGIGASGTTAFVDQAVPFLFASSGGIAICNETFSTNCSQPSGNGALLLGAGLDASGQYSIAAGPGSKATGLGGSAWGHGTLSTGIYSETHGQSSKDRGRQGAYCWASNSITVNGDGQSCQQDFGQQGTAAASPVTVNMTSNASTTQSTSNEMNTDGNGQVFAIDLSCAAQDVTTPANAAVWGAWRGILSRNGTGVMTWTAITTGTPTVIGTATAIAITPSADGTNKGLGLTFTPPTSGATDIWRAHCKVQSTEVQ